MSTESNPISTVSVEAPSGPQVSEVSTSIAMTRKARLVDFLASGFYLGYAPVASGTFGTLAGVLYYLPLRNLSWMIYLGVVVALTALACWIAHEAEPIYGQKDSGKIVIDEIIGYLVTLTAVSTREHPIAVLTVAFFLFRVFDILKPFPARWIDRKMGGGAGVVLDDFFAGIYACLTLHGLLYLWTKVL